MTDSQIAQDTYRVRLYKKRCGTCKHVCVDNQNEEWCFLTATDVDCNGICKLWKERE